MRRKHSSNEDDLDSLLNSGVVGNLPKYANKITLKVWPVTLYFVIPMEGESFYTSYIIITYIICELTTFVLLLLLFLFTFSFSG